MNALATADQSPVASLASRSMEQAGIPSEGCRDGAAIAEIDDNRRVENTSSDGRRNPGFRRRSTHAMPSGEIPDDRLRAAGSEIAHTAPFRDCRTVGPDSARTWRPRLRTRRERAQPRLDHRSRRRTETARRGESSALAAILWAPATRSMTTRRTFAARWLPTHLLVGHQQNEHHEREADDLRREEPEAHVELQPRTGSDVRDRLADTSA